LGIWVSFAILRGFGLPDFYDKLLVVPLLNLSVRGLDCIARSAPFSAFGRWEGSLGLRRLNLIHMGCWSLLFAIMLGTGFIERALPVIQKRAGQPGGATISPMAPAAGAATG
jgi:hypothetical protein